MPLKRLQKGVPAKEAFGIGTAIKYLWRYRKKPEYFERAPLDVMTNCFRIINVSNENLRYILGLPTGKSDEK